MARGSSSGGRSAREGKGRGKVQFKTVLIARGSGTAGGRYHSKIKIGVARDSSTAVKKGDTQNTAKRKKDKEESAMETSNQDTAKGKSVNMEREE